jgi:UDP-glucuronate 4-epimerase
MPQQNRYLVTGVAGFIGSHLAETLLNQGHAVVGVDALTDHYDPAAKRRNIEPLRSSPGFRFIQADLLEADLSALLGDVDIVFHEAGQPGVRRSWGREFEPYVRNNVLVTQRLLEAAKGAALSRFVFASSSSIYGDAQTLPVSEASLPRPRSPYGVTKLAAEHLCGLYAREFGIPTISLRYFTVYGPRQRPDMAISRFIHALRAGEEIVVHGDGEQSRDFTFVADVVRANLSAALATLPRTDGPVYNLGGGTRTSVNAVIRLLEGLTGATARIRTAPGEAGDVQHTWADCRAARADLGFTPLTELEVGLRAQVAWQAAEEERSIAKRAA